jgi:hypothetical protein
LKIKATNDFIEHKDLNIVARDANNDVTKVKISIGYISFHKVPLTSKYFNLGRYKTEGDMILGFNSNVITDPHMLDEFNALDFSDLTGTNIKYVSSDCRFRLLDFRQ